MKISSATNCTTADFDGFMAILRGNVKTSNTVFSVELPDDIWETYLRCFPEYDRQKYNCRCCKSFIRKYAGLATISTEGATVPLLWDINKDYGYFNRLVNVMHYIVSSRKVHHQAVFDDGVLGKPMEGGWSHLSVISLGSMVNCSRILTAPQVEAAKIQDYQMLSRTTSNISIGQLEAVRNLLMSGKLNNPEAFSGMVDWYLDTHTTIDMYPSNASNIKWEAVGSAPVGYCNINSSVVGSLINDLTMMSTSRAISNFNDRVSPLKYRRPKSAPGAQNIKRGEELVEKLGISSSLERRYATIEDVVLSWTPKRSAAKVNSGVFGSVVPRGKSKCVSSINDKPMTYARFARTVLPTAETLELQAPVHGSYTALCTAVNPQSPLIFQWSNRVNWYVYPNGSKASDWNVHDGWTEVSGITMQPNMWNNECGHQGSSVFFLLDGAKPKLTVGLALFPQVLRNELHEVRKTIESFSNTNKLQGLDRASACGYRMDDQGSIKVRVTSGGNSTVYILSQLD